MGFTVDGFNQAKSDMASAFNKALDDADQLRKVAVAPPHFIEVPGGAGVSLADTSEAAVGSIGNQLDKAPA